MPYKNFNLKNLIINIPDIRYSGYHTALIKIVNVKTGEMTGLDAATFKAFIYAPVVVASETIGKFQIIKSKDIKISYKSIPSLYDDYFLNIKKAVGREAKFFIAGTGGLKDALIKRAKDLNIFNSIYFVGFVSGNLVSFLNELDVVVFPSLKEGLPLALLEAMSMKKIVVVSDAGGMPEVVEEGKNGYVIKKGDINAIYQKLIFVYNNRIGLNAIADSAAKTIKEKFDIENCANNTLDLFVKFL